MIVGGGDRDKHYDGQSHVLAACAADAARLSLHRGPRLPADDRAHLPAVRALTPLAGRAAKSLPRPGRVSMQSFASKPVAEF